MGPLMYWDDLNRYSPPWTMAAVAEGVSVPACVSRGIWRAKCPACSCLTPVTLSATFFCIGCRNSTVNGQLITVCFPRGRKRIERELMALPLPSRNWEWSPNDDIEQAPGADWDSALDPAPGAIEEIDDDEDNAR